MNGCQIEVEIGGMASNESSLRRTIEELKVELLEIKVLLAQKELGNGIEFECVHCGERQIVVVHKFYLSTDDMGVQYACRSCGAAHGEKEFGCGVFSVAREDIVKANDITWT